MSSSTIIGGGSSSSIKTSSTLLMVLGCVVAVAGVAMTVSHLRGRRAPIVTADASAASTSASASAKKKAKKKRGKKSLKPSAESMTESETVPVPVAPAPSPVTPVNSSEDAKVPVVAAPSPVATVPASKAVPSPVKKEEVPEKKKETPAISIPASLTPSDDELAALSKADRAARALEAKALGNKFFTSKRYEKGIELYSMAIRLNPDPVYFSNRAACYASLNDFANVVADCNRALELDQHYVKALTRRARAYENLGQASNALNGEIASSCIYLLSLLKHSHSKKKTTRPFVSLKSLKMRVP